MVFIAWSQWLKKVYTSRDVKFVENVFRFKENDTGVILDKVNDRRQVEWEMDKVEHVEVADSNSIMEAQLEQDEMNSKVVNEQTQVSVNTRKTEQKQDVRLRRSERTRRQPKHLEPYATELPKSIDHSQPTSNSGTSEVYPLSHFVSYDKFSHAHKVYLAAITAHDEPKYLHQAIENEQ